MPEFTRNISEYATIVQILQTFKNLPFYFKFAKKIEDLYDPFFLFFRTQFIEEFVESLQGVPLEKLATPTSHPRQVSHHVDRFINNKIFGTVEDKLARLSEPPQDKPKEQNGISANSKSIPTS